MGRGIHETTKIKKEIKLTAKTAAAIEKGKQDIDRKNFWKNLPQKLGDALVDSIKNIQWIEVVAVGATAYIVHGVIVSYSDLLAQANKFSKGLRILSGTPEIIGLLPGADTPFGWLSNIPFLIATLIEGLSESEAERVVKGVQTMIAEPESSDSIFVWLLSIAIAYYIQKHGIPDILGTIKMFLGIATTPTP